MKTPLLLRKEKGWIENIRLRGKINFIGQFQHAGQCKKNLKR